MTTEPLILPTPEGWTHCTPARGAAMMRGKSNFDFTLTLDGVTAPIISFDFNYARTHAVDVEIMKMAYNEREIILLIGMERLVRAEQDEDSYRFTRIVNIAEAMALIEVRVGALSTARHHLSYDTVAECEKHRVLLRELRLLCNSREDMLKSHLNGLKARIGSSQS